MTVLCCGSRDWDDIQEVVKRLEKLPRGTTIVHGGANGADTICGLVAEELGLEVKVYSANWQQEGRKAGILRNSWMLSDSKPDLVIAFKTSPTSTGTNHMVLIADRAGIDVEIVRGY